MKKVCVIFLFLFLIVTVAPLVKAADPLMNPGKIRTCLTPTSLVRSVKGRNEGVQGKEPKKGYKDPKTGERVERPPRQGTGGSGNNYNIQLTGQCLAPGGCDCLNCQGSSCTLCKIKPKLAYGPVNISGVENFNIPYHGAAFSFYAVGDAPVPTPAPTRATTNDSSLKQGEIDQFIDLDAEGLAKNCAAVSWDPFGRVFDTVSLEPMPEVEVTLIDNVTKQPAVQQFEPNYSITGADGLFNILVEYEGFYQLSVKPPLTHQFTNSTVINPKYSLIYSDLYYPNTVFEETESLATHHDIPLQPKSDPYVSLPSLIERTLESLDMGNMVIYKGRVSHPFSTICLVGETNKTEYACSTADKYGIFVIGLEKFKVPDEKLMITITKADLNKITPTPTITPTKAPTPTKTPTPTTTSKTKNFINNFLHKLLSLLPITTKKVQAQQTVKILLSPTKIPTTTNTVTTKFGFDPILNYLEGYAYDNQGNKLPNAKVVIKFKMNDKQAYATTADSTGFFTVQTKNIPAVEYYLQITPSGTTKPITQTTTEFVKNNQTYLTSKNLNLVTATTKDGKPNAGVAQSTINKTSQTKYIIIVLIILLLIIIVLVFLFTYIKRKKENAVTGSTDI